MPDGSLTKDEALRAVKALPDIKALLKNDDREARKAVGAIVVQLPDDVLDAFNKDLQTWLDLVLTKDEAMAQVKALKNKALLKAGDEGAVQDVVGIVACVKAGELQPFEDDFRAWLGLTKDEALAAVKKLPDIKERIKERAKAKGKGPVPEVAVLQTGVQAGELQAFKDELDVWVKAP